MRDVEGTPRGPQSKWATPERLEKVRRLILDGVSHADVAKKLGAGCTKDTVAHIIDRWLPELKEKNRVVDGRTPNGASMMRQLKPTSQFASGGCSWIAGDPADARRGKDPFCGKKRLPGKSYCAEHEDIAHPKVGKNRQPLTVEQDRRERLRHAEAVRSGLMFENRRFSAT